MRMPRPRLRYVWLSLAVVAGSGAVAVVSPGFAAATLRSGAAAHGKYFGTAVDASVLSSDATYSSIAGSEFSQVTPGNEMKWDFTEATDNQYTFTKADQIVAFAQAHNQTVHGHTLVWHSQTRAGYRT